MTIGQIIKKIFTKLGLELNLIKYSSDYNLLGFRNFDFDVVIDVGANKGNYVKKFLEAFPKAEIYAFEPLPDMFSQLKEIKNKNVHVYNLAIADKSGFLPFYFDVDDPSASSFLKNTDFSKKMWRRSKLRHKKIKVPIATLDEIMTEKIKPSTKILVKIDVQGYEMEVIAGAKKTLKKSIACVLEISRAAHYKNQPDFDEIYQAMKKLGYEYVGNWFQCIFRNGAIAYLDAFFVKKDFLKSVSYHKIEERGLRL